MKGIVNGLLAALTLVVVLGMIGLISIAQDTTFTVITGATAFIILLLVGKVIKSNQ